jgi:hypothetical protein
MTLSIVAVLAVGAIAASGASAKSLLTLKTGAGALVEGSPIKASSSDMVFVTAAGNLECTSNVLEGTMTTNKGAKDKGVVTSESSTGALEGGACNTTTPFGPAVLTSGNFNWPIEFSTKATNALKGTKKVKFTSVFPLAEGAQCTFESAKVSSTFNVGGPITLTTTNQSFKINKKFSNPACPKEGLLSGHFSLTSSGEAVEAEL